MRRPPDGTFERIISDGVHGLAPGGTGGEFIALSFAQRQQLVELALEASNHRVPVYAGTGDPILPLQPTHGIALNYLRQIVPRIQREGGRAKFGRAQSCQIQRSDVPRLY